jgi:hypothetical protein
VIEGAHTINMSNYRGKAHPLTTTNLIIPGSIGIGILNDIFIIRIRIFGL